MKLDDFMHELKLWSIVKDCRYPYTHKILGKTYIPVMEAGRLKSWIVR